jgi:hypothetical protein
MGVMSSMILLGVRLWSFMVGGLMPLERTGEVGYWTAA